MSGLVRITSLLLYTNTAYWDYLTNSHISKNYFQLSTSINSVLKISENRIFNHCCIGKFSPALQLNNSLFYFLYVVIQLKSLV